MSASKNHTSWGGSCWKDMGLSKCKLASCYFRPFRKFRTFCSGNILLVLIILPLPWMTTHPEGARADALAGDQGGKSFLGLNYRCPCSCLSTEVCPVQCWVSYQNCGVLSSGGLTAGHVMWQVVLAYMVPVAGQGNLTWLKPGVNLTQPHSTLPVSISPEQIWQRKIKMDLSKGFFGYTFSDTA